MLGLESPKSYPPRVNPANGRTYLAYYSFDYAAGGSAETYLSLVEDYPEHLWIAERYPSMALDSSCLMVVQGFRLTFDFEHGYKLADEAGNMPRPTLNLRPELRRRIESERHTAAHFATLDDAEASLVGRRQCFIDDTTDVRSAPSQRHAAHLIVAAYDGQLARVRSPVLRDKHETVNWIDVERGSGPADRSLLGDLLLEAISHTHPDPAKTWPELDPKAMQVALLVDGQELAVRPIVDRWESLIDKMVRDKAQELLQQRFRDLQDTAYSFASVVEEALGDAQRQIKLGFRAAFPETDHE